VLGAVDVGLDDVDEHPPLGAPPARDVGVGDHLDRHVGLVENLGVLDHVGSAVDVEAHRVVEEVDKEHPDVGVGDHVGQAGHDPVAPVLGVGQALRGERTHEPGGTGPERAVAVPLLVGGGDEHHLHAGQEGSHLVVEMVEDLTVVEPLCPGLGTRGALQLTFHR